MPCRVVKKTAEKTASQIASRFWQSHVALGGAGAQQWANLTRNLVLEVCTRSREVVCIAQVARNLVRLEHLNPWVPWSREVPGAHCASRGVAVCRVVKPDPHGGLLQHQQLGIP